MRQQNNGRRRQNRGSSRRNFGNGNFNNNLNKNTVIESSGPDGRQRGSVAQLNEKYISLASDASSSDDHILAESFLQFADHYYRLLKEIEVIAEQREMKQKAESKPVENNSINIEVDHNENTQKKLSRKKRGFEIREAELIASKNKDDSKKTNEIDSEDISVSNALA
ncbi:DUF4167 domain-containing protein [Alphaproteobacteria bacterium]|nr:DUF4167 domain-containing protein [Alphaproteobacteria bacterium]